jgi:hypothetical protein
VVVMFAPLRAITSMTSEKCLPVLEVDSFVQEVRTFDRHLPFCGKVDQSEAILMCTLMQAVLAYRWLLYGFPANFLRSRLPSPTVRMPTSAVHKIDLWPPLLSHLLVHVC